ncbi:MAG: SDR family oxidoreductase [Ardenticatenaceae bacterium]|nr:SDR family oxidoreductase [Ardenticatenaceae bacterium]MCB8986139.1 SDR family oxidoreductase [Ardenticatenaceae bacterium]
MKIAIFGGSRGVGRQALEQALAQGHAVQALLRHPETFDFDHPHLAVIAGDVLRPEDAAATVAGADAVVCSLGSTADNPGDVVSRGTQNIITAMQAAGVKRLVVVSSIGVGDSKDQVPLAFKVLMKTVLKAAMEEKEKQEAAVRASGLDWVIVRPGGLTDGPYTGNYKFGLEKSIKAGQISRADVAEFVLNQLTDDTFLHQAPSIS